MKTLKYLLPIFLMGASMVSCKEGNDPRNNKEKTFNVSFVTNDYVTFTGENLVNEGDNYTFSVTKTNTVKYNYASMKVYVNNQAVKLVHDSYTVNDVHNDLTISVSDVTTFTYSVTFIENEAVSFIGESEAIRGEDYTFKVECTNEDEYNYSNMEVLSNGRVITPTDGGYTIPNVSASQTIMVRGIESLYHQITLDSKDYIALDGENRVKDGNDYVFSIIKTRDITNLTNIKVFANSIEVNKENGKYVIKNVISDITITVTGVTYDDPNEDDDENMGDNFIPDLE